MYIIHTGDFYYPGSDEYDTLEEAKEAFKNLKLQRDDEMRSYPMFDKDYLCEVIDVIDKEKLEWEMS
jgi:hypothetical protein